MADNENNVSGTEESIQQNGIPVITMEVNPLTVIPNAVDTTLLNSGEAADAKATGDRIRSIEDQLPDIEADIGDLDQALTAITDPTEGDLKTLDDKIDTVREDLEQAISDTADGLIPKTDISATLDTTGKVADAKAVGDAIAALDGETLLYETGGTDSIRDVVNGIETRVDSVEDRTANDIEYVSGGATIKAKVDEVIASQPFGVHFNEDLTIVRATINDQRITAGHYVMDNTVLHPANVTWTTGAGTLTVECTAGIPEMNLTLAIPATI